MIGRGGRPSPGRPRRWLRAAALPLALGVAVQGCGTALGRYFSPGSGPYDTGVLRLSEGDFSAADSAFRETASHCESGSRGRKALLFLALLHQDPRNPGAAPDTAALMAGRLLQLPGASPEERTQAEALYVSALERGADPRLRPDPGAPGLAHRFEWCDDSAPPRPDTEVVYPERPATRTLPGLRAERDSLAGQNKKLSRTVAELQAELERIRKLLRLPDTSMVRLPGGA
jgi:hypothetical protein